jgi:outer membrane protein assembly factor BamA
LDPGKLKYVAAIRAFFLTFLLFTGPFAFTQSFSSAANAKAFTRIDSISLAGNKITRDPIILREIIFKAGDTVRLDMLDSLMQRSRENLLNTSLFNFVDFSKRYTGNDSTKAVIRVALTERWYIWPTPILKISDRNFNVWWQTKDFSRLSYGFYVDWQNFRGRKENLVMKLQWGYDRIVMLTYKIPYLNRRKTLGMGFSFAYARQKETAYQTVHNKQEFYLDSAGYARQDISAYGQLIIRRNIYNTHQVQLGYDRHHFSDSLLQANENYSINLATEVQYLSFGYFFKSDHRDFKQYPLKGYYFDFELLKYGIWTFEMNTLNTIHLLATFRKYFALHPRIYFATGFNGKASAGLQPYFILRGIGYDRDIVRSYEYYLVDAQHFGILKNNFKFAIIPTQVRKINFIRTEKFSRIYYALYLNLFFDAGYGFYNQDFGQETNDLQNELLLGYGAGLDFVTYYDVVVRFEFSVNKMNETGFFLHFTAPI